MQNFNVSVIIPNYNGRELLEKNLPSIVSASKVRKNCIKEIIVVDDASQDESIKTIKTLFSEVRIIKHKVNRGFSYAINTGSRSAKGNLLALLNSDVSVAENFLISVIPHFENEEVFAVSLHEKGYGWSKGKFEEGFITHAPGAESKTTHATFWVSGGSGVVRKLPFMALGGMDEKLFSPFYWEDVDLSYRAMKRGFALLWEPESKVLHEHEATTKRVPSRFRQRIHERNQLLFIWKNLTSNNLFRKHITGLLKRLGKHPGYIRVVLSAILKYREVLKSRKKEIKEGKMSDEAIFAKFQ